MKVDVVIVTYNRAHELANTLANVGRMREEINQLIVVDNNSSDHTAEVLVEIQDEKLIVVRNNENLGPAGGRNVGINISNAEIIILIDDDAFFSSKEPIETTKKFFYNNDDVGIIQFKIVNYHSRKILPYEFPGINPEINGDKQFETSYFIGAGHALRRSMIDRIGYYPDEFLYGHEEIDLSYRAIDAGYKIVYLPDVSVFHKKDPSGRLPPKEVSRHLLLNRLIMNWRYLPTRYAIGNSILWFMKTAAATRSLKVPLRAVAEFLSRRRMTNRNVLAPTTIAYMRRHYGRLYK